MCVQLSVDGTAWVDHSDQVSVIESPVQTRTSGELAVFGEDTMVPTTGKLEPLEITIRGPYLDATATTNAFGLLYSRWTTACGGELNVRWAPAGCATTNQVFSTATATGGYSKLVSLTWPGGEAGSADPLVYEAVIRAPFIFRAVYAA